MRKKKLKKVEQKNDYTQIIQELQNISENEFIKNHSVFSDDLLKIIQRISDLSFNMAIVGEFSSGKSTFLNALIGKDILKHGAKETTATITEIVNIADCKANDLFDVNYLDGNFEKDLPLELLEEYSSTSSINHSVANEIERVTIKTHVIDSEYPVSFIDTPGLNGVADHHKAKTIEQVKQAHACIYLLQVRGISQSDINFIRYISNYQHNIIFVQNFIDELKELEGENPEEKIAEQKRILKEKVFYDFPQIKYDIVGISARKALIARDETIKEYNKKNIDDVCRERLYAESRFDDVISLIERIMEQNYKECIQQKDSIAIAKNILCQLLDIFKTRGDREAKEWESTPEARVSRGYERIKLSLIENKIAYQKKICNLVEAESDNIRKRSKNKIETDLETLIDTIKSHIDKIATIDEFEAFIKNNSASSKLNSGVSEVEIQSNQLMDAGFENLICNAILRIKEYTGGELNKSVVPKFVSEGIKGNDSFQNFAQEENEIIKLTKEIANVNAELDMQKKKKTELESQLTSIDSNIRNKQNQIQQKEIQKKWEITSLGEQPDALTKYREETYYENRGGLGILDALLGPKERTRSVPYRDDTNQQQWKKRKSDIETRFSHEENKIRAESRLLANRLQEYKDEIKHYELLDPKKAEEIRSTRALIDAKIKEVEEKRKKAQYEYLKTLKVDLIDDLRMYLFQRENVCDCIIRNFEEVFLNGKDRAMKIVMSLFNISFEERVDALECLIANRDSFENI